jgi:hypothetical protein
MGARQADDDRKNSSNWFDCRAGRNGRADRRSDARAGRYRHRPQAAADCSRAASQVVGQTGGQLLSASAQTQGGQVVCVITVLVPGNGSERPKKVTVSVPQ